MTISIGVTPTGNFGRGRTIASGALGSCLGSFDFGLVSAVRKVGTSLVEGGGMKALGVWEDAVIAVVATKDFPER